MADPVYLTINEFPGTGAAAPTVVDFNFAGGYISPAHVKAEIFNPVTYLRTPVPVTDDNFVTDYRLSLPVVVPTGSILRVYRDTPKDQPLVDFTNGARIAENNLDLVARQAVFVAAESADQIEATQVADVLQAVEAAALSAAAAQADAAASAASATLSQAAAQEGASIAGGFALTAAESAAASSVAASAAASSAAAAAGVRDDLASPASGKGAEMVANQNGGTVQDHIDSIDAFVIASQAFMSALPSLSEGPPPAVLAANPLGKIRVPVGTTTVSDLQLYGQCLDGQGLGAVLKAGAGASTAVRLGFINTPGQWARKTIRDLVIDGNTKLSDGATYSSASNSEVSGRWSWDGFAIINCAKGIHKPTGNIGNSYRNGMFAGNDFGVYAIGQISPAMHAGCDTFEDVDFSSHALAACYYDGGVGASGGLMFGKNTTIQYNPGFGVFVKDWPTSYTPVVFDGAWFEGNGTSPNVTINGTVYTPCDLRLDNVAQAVLKNGIVPAIQLVNSNLSIDSSLLLGGLTSITADAGSVITCTNASIEGGLHPLEVQSITRSSKETGNFAAAWWAPARASLITGLSEKLLSQPFTSVVTFGGTHTPATSLVSDGRIYATCGELPVPASATITAVPTIANLIAGKWAVMTIDVKHVSGALEQLVLGQINAQSLIGNYAPLLRTGKWKTIACVAPVAATGATAMYITNGAGGAQVLRLSAMQVLQFDAEQDAIDYCNGRGFAL